MPAHRSLRVAAAVAALALALAACGNGTEEEDAEPGEEAVEDVPDGPTVTVAGFNFPESSILAEIYAQTLEDAGYPVDRQLDLGARELVLPELAAGSLDLLPEYVGSALVTGFDQEAPEDLDAGIEALQESFGELDAQVLEPAPAQNSNVFVVTEEYAEEYGVTSIVDLEGLQDVTVAGAPECEERLTCFLGLTDIYGLDGVEFESIQESSARVEALDAGNVEVILLFSTDAVLGFGGLQVLDDPQGMVPPENIVPVVRDEIVDAYGDDLVALLDDVSARITTETLVELNTEAGEGVAPDQIASDWLAEQ